RVLGLGGGGLIGLAALYGAFLAPIAAMLWRFPGRTWNEPAMAAPAALAAFLPTYAIDCLMNAMVNPMWTIGMGALAGLVMVRDPCGAAAPAALWSDNGHERSAARSSVAGPAIATARGY